MQQPSNRWLCDYASGSIILLQGLLHIQLLSVKSDWPMHKTLKTSFCSQSLYKNGVKIKKTPSEKTCSNLFYLKFPLRFPLDQIQIYVTYICNDLAYNHKLQLMVNTPALNRDNGQDMEMRKTLQFYVRLVGVRNWMCVLCQWR